MRYLVWSPNYSHASGGPKVLHRLCHELNEARQEAYVSSPVTNPEWKTPFYEPPDGPLDADRIAVYPEVVQGNPWGASRIARWALNVPGKRGGDPAFGPDELVFTYDAQYLAGVPVLCLPAVETDIYIDRHEARDGEAFYVGKGEKTRDLDSAAEVTLAMREDRHALADLLNRSTLLYCFDDTTAMVQIALLCGCPVLIVPASRCLMADSRAYRASYIASYDTFREQLADFIRITQAAA